MSIAREHERPVCIGGRLHERFMRAVPAHALGLLASNLNLALQRELLSGLLCCQVLQLRLLLVQQLCDLLIRPQ
jgi:hypothetical protein